MFAVKTMGNNVTLMGSAAGIVTKLRRYEGFAAFIEYIYKFCSHILLSSFSAFPQICVPKCEPAGNECQASLSTPCCEVSIPVSTQLP